MTEYTVSKANDLDLIPTRDDLIIVVSDPAIPAGPNKRSKKITAGSLRVNAIDWDPTVVTDPSTLPNVKVGSFLNVVNSENPSIFGDYAIYNGDTLIVLSLSPSVTLSLIPNNIARKQKVYDLTANATPVPIEANSVVYVDVSDGSVTLDIAEGSISSDSINIIPVGGKYSINNLFISSDFPIAGVLDSVNVDIDDLQLQLRWKDNISGWVIISL